MAEHGTPAWGAYAAEQLLAVAVSLSLVVPLAAQALEVWYRSTRRFKLLAFERLSRRETAARQRRGSSSAVSVSQASSAAVAYPVAAAALPATVPRVNLVCNWLLGAALLVNLARCVDPSGARGTYPVDVLHALDAAAGAAVLAAVTFVSYYACGVGYKIQQRRRPAWLGAVAAVMAAAVACGAAGPLVARFWTDDAFWAHGVNYWVGGVAMLHATALLLHGMDLLHGAASGFVDAASVQTRERLPYLVQALRRLRYARAAVLLADVVALPALAVAGLAALRSDETVRERFGSPHGSYTVRHSLPFWASSLAAGLVLLYVWLPLSRDTGRELYAAPREVSSHAGWSESGAGGAGGGGGATHSAGGTFSRAGRGSRETLHPLSDLDENERDEWRRDSVSSVSVMSNVMSDVVY